MSSVPRQKPQDLEDFYYDGPFVVFTAAYLRKRGTCCGNGCRHCPYDEHGNIVRGKGEQPTPHPGRDLPESFRDAT